MTTPETDLRALDAELATAMGIRVQWRMRPEWEGHYVRHGLWQVNYRPSGPVSYSILPCYTCSHSDFSRVEDEIDQRGLGEAYITECLGLLFGPCSFPARGRVWEILRAPLPVKCRAALAVLTASERGEG